MTEITIPHKFLCRPYQREAWEALDAGKKRIVCAWHRGAGKDLFCLNYLIYRMIQSPGVYLHCFPKHNQAKRAIWKGVHETHDGESMGYLDHFPPEIVKAKNGSEMSIELINGAVYHLLGVDGKNASAARGMNPKFVIFSEYAFMDREAWDTIEPRLSQNNGQALFISTPNGQNHFYKLFEYAKGATQDKNNPQSDQYYASLLTIDDTSVFDSGFIEGKRAEGMPEDFIQQEYYCSFTRGAEGSYYGKQIQAVKDEERITRLNPVPDIKCHTAWDIGVGDASSIFIFQQLSNGKINFLDYYENQGEGLEHYLGYLDKYRDKNKIMWGTHYVPHDMRNREFTSGISRMEVAEKMGYKMTPVLKNGQAYGLEEGIQVVRSTLPNCVFNSTIRDTGVKCLEFYRKKYNEALKVYYDQPLHDKYSHGADAFRMACVGLKEIGEPGKLSADSIAEMRRKYTGF